jgi:AGZA family xanthine/uracil permease-like MFS transporter
VALFGLTSIISAVVPIEAGMAIVLWIGIVITAQAFQATPRAHAPAVAIGLFPAIAAWGALVVTLTLGAVDVAMRSFGMTDQTLSALVLEKPDAFAAAGLILTGLVAISQGFMLTCLVWAAASAHLIDRHFPRAAIWMVAGGVLAFFGFIHAGRLTPAGAVYDIGFATGWRWSVGYALCAAFFAAVGWGQEPKPVDATGGPEL